MGSGNSNLRKIDGEQVLAPITPFLNNGERDKIFKKNMYASVQNYGKSAQLTPVEGKKIERILQLVMAIDLSKPQQSVNLMFYTLIAAVTNLNIGSSGVESLNMFVIRVINEADKTNTTMDDVEGRLRKINIPAEDIQIIQCDINNYAIQNTVPHNNGFFVPPSTPESTKDLQCPHSAKYMALSQKDS